LKAVSLRRVHHRAPGGAHRSCPADAARVVSRWWFRACLVRQALRLRHPGGSCRRPWRRARRHRPHRPRFRGAG